MTADEIIKQALDQLNTHCAPEGHKWYSLPFEAIPDRIMFFLVEEH